MMHFRIAAARLPLPHRSPGDAQQVGQARLRQPNACPQGQHRLTEIIITLTIGESFHKRAPLLPRDPQAPGQQWEVMESDMLTDGD
jgi:hypothetical protein